MSYQIEALPGEPSVSSPTQSLVPGKSVDAELMSMLRKMSREAAMESAMLAHVQSEKAIEALWDKMVAKLDSIERPQPQVLAVRYNDIELRKLSRPAPKYLGKMLDHARVGHAVMLIGPAGCGKSTAAEIFAEALKLPFAGLSFSKGASETWLMGRQLPTGFLPAEFCKVFEHGGVFMADEIDAADENLLLTLNNALANGWFYNPIEGRRINKHKDFRCVAGANTFGKGSDGAVYTGRCRLDGATLDRFWRIEVDYDRDLEKGLVPDSSLCKLFWKMRESLKKLGSEEFLSTRKLVQAYDLIAQCGWSYSQVFDSLTLGWQEEIAEACRIHLKAIEKKEEKEAAQADQGEAAKLVEELAKAKAENEALKKPARKAFGGK